MPAQHRRPRLLDHQEAPLVRAAGRAVALDHLRVDAEERNRAAPRLGVGDPRQRRHHDAARLGLPPGVDDRAAPAADDLVVPHPGLGVDRLADAAEQPQRREIVLLRQIVAPADEGADRRRRRVEDGDLVPLDDRPEAVLLGGIGRPFVHDGGGAVGERAVDDVAVPGDPADVGGAPVDVVLAQVEDVLGRQVRAQQVAAGRVHDPLRLPGRPRGVEDEERMLGRQARRGALRGDPLHLLVPPDVPPRLHLHGVVGAAHDQAALHRRRLLERAIDVRLQRNRLAAPPSAVGGDAERWRRSR